jgi:hypothetical protein
LVLDWFWMGLFLGGFCLSDVVAAAVNGWVWRRAAGRVQGPSDEESVFLTSVKLYLAAFSARPGNFSLKFLTAEVMLNLGRPNHPDFLPLPWGWEREKEREGEIVVETADSLRPRVRSRSALPLLNACPTFSTTMTAGPPSQPAIPSRPAPAAAAPTAPS